MGVILQGKRHDKKTRNLEKKTTKTKRQKIVSQKMSKFFQQID